MNFKWHMMEARGKRSEKRESVAKASLSSRYFPLLSISWLVAGTWASSLAAAERLPRVVSINTCTDQLVLALAEPAQIAGLSRFARNPEMSYLAIEAGRYPRLRGTAEEVLRLAPDVVLAGAFSGRATREILAAHRVRVETFAPPTNMTEARGEIERAAALLGQAERGRALLRAVDEALGRAETATRSRPRASVLAVARRGFVSGPDTLLSAVLAVSGLDNAAARIGVRSIGQVSLETIVKLAPDALVVEGTSSAPDQATAFLRHPLLERAFPAARRIALPVAELTCGGPSLPPLIDRVAGHTAGLPR